MQLLQLTECLFLKKLYQRMQAPRKFIQREEVEGHGMSSSFGFLIVFVESGSFVLDR